MSEATSERTRSKPTGGATRERILEGALAVFAEKGYHGANVDDIAAASGVSKGGFYFHFPSKQELFLTLLDEMGEILVGAIREAASGGADPRERVGLALRKGLHVFSRYEGLARFLLIESAVSGEAFEARRTAIYARLERVLREEFEAAREEGAIAEGIDLDLAASMWVGAIAHMVMRGLMTGDADFERRFDAVRALLYPSVGW